MSEKIHHTAHTSMPETIADTENDAGGKSASAATQTPLADDASAGTFKGHAILPFNLVLEGGAMRGLFTSGVCDFLLEHHLLAQQTIGVSAGALNGFNYVCGEFGRSVYLNLKYCDDWHYLSLRNYLQTGNAFGVDFVFDKIPHELDPFDMDAVYRTPMKLTTVASDIELGEADYHDYRNPGNDTPYMIASSAMPFVSQITEVDGKKLLDGGVCDSVPLMYSQLTGAKKHVVVLTRDKDYVKQPSKAVILAHRRYADYPHYIERIANRYYEYNRTYRMLARLHEQSEIFVLRPPAPVEIATMEHDRDKLLALYAQGYEQAALNYDALMRYLEE